MKTHLIFLFALAGMQLMGQSPDIPEKVISAFSEKYPEAEEVNWFQRKDTYQAEFFDFFQTIAVFNKEAVWLKTISLLTDEDLPDKVYEYLDEYHDLEAISQIHLIENNKNVITYKVVLFEESGKVTLEFSEEGELL